MVCGFEYPLRFKYRSNVIFLTERAYCGFVVDNNFLTFDGFALTNYGGCSYILAENCRGGQPDFHVIQHMEGNLWRPIIKAIEVDVYDKVRNITCYCVLKVIMRGKVMTY